MLSCKVFGETGEELASFPISHFSERIGDTTVTLSCVISVDTESAANNAIDKYYPIFNKKLSKIQMFKNEELFIEFSNYSNVASIQMDYSSTEMTVIMLFVRPIQTY
jgi:hypothetical protein